MASNFPDHVHVLLYGHLEWEQAVGDQAFDAAGRRENVRAEKSADLERVTELVQGATLTVSNNTGIRNLAIAMERPSLGIFVKSVPFKYWPRFGRHEVVYNMDLSPPSLERVFDTAAKLLRSFKRNGPGSA